MSEATQHMPSDPSGPCDQLIDFAYDELSGAEADAFKTHLEGCAKCQADLAALKRVRGAVKAALPMVEPSAVVTGALHAQLLHAAAQRARGKPHSVEAPRGKMLAFVRKVVMHPAYAAAAMVILVGGAVGIQWSRGRLLMPAPVAEETVAPTATPALEAPAAAPAASPAGTFFGKEDSAKGAAPMDKSERASVAKESAKLAAQLDTLSKTGKDSLNLEIAGKAMPVHSAAPVRRDSYGDNNGFTNTVPSAKKRALSNDPANPLAGLDDLTVEKDTRYHGNVVGAPANKNSVGRTIAAGGETRGATGSPGANQPEWNAQTSTMAGSVTSKSSPPPPPKASAPASVAASADREGNDAPVDRPRAEYKSQQQVVVDGKLAGPRSGSGGAIAGDAKPQEQKPVIALPRAPQGQAQGTSAGLLTRNAEGLRKKADDLAASGRCDEAVRMFQDLEKSYPTYRMTPKDRLPYVKCLRQTGRLQQASDELDSLKREKAVDNRMIHDEELQLQQRMRAPAPSKQIAQPKAAEPKTPDQRQVQEARPARGKAKKGAAADAYEAPVQAAPAEASKPGF